KPASPVPAPPAARAPAPGKSGEERGPGWLSDLLARASREEAPAAARPTAAARPAATAEPKASDALAAITRDIPRMIDHDAAVSLWDRYYRGDQNVFSRRIYTPQGQQTFDELRRRYRGDAAFRDAVDRYAEDFERLLQDVGRDDRDGAMVRQYLTSDTGKVYTMLAHAGERFEA
ncbi:MAG: hypothetical protein JWN93_2816, partial [Hyphomicrobiales bacterium]|nr:hypothetical protein [Hyphomicrobiales bacterium]